MVYPEFAAACRANEQSRTARVEAALYQRAVGYEHFGEKLFYDRDSGVVRAVVSTHVPANVQAALEWLAARDPERWCVAREEVGTSADGIEITGGLPEAG